MPGLKRQSISFEKESRTHNRNEIRSGSELGRIFERDLFDYRLRRKTIYNELR